MPRATKSEDSRSRTDHLEKNDLAEAAVERRALKKEQQRTRSRQALPNNPSLKEGDESTEHGMHIVVQMLDGKTIMLEVKASDTINIVKAKLNLMGMGTPDCELGLDGCKLEDRHMLLRYGITSGTELHELRMQIFV